MNAKLAFKENALKGSKVIGKYHGISRGFSSYKGLTWEHFEDITNQLAKTNETTLHFLRDEKGNISKVKFDKLLERFNYYHESFENVREIISSDWFCGFMDRESAQKALENATPGTFLVRFDENEMRSYVLSFRHEYSVQHVAILAEITGSEGTEMTFKTNPSINQNYEMAYSSLARFVESYDFDGNFVEIGSLRPIHLILPFGTNVGYDPFVV